MSARKSVLVEATREIKNVGLVHSLKKERPITIPRGTLGILLDYTALPKAGSVDVVFEHGSSNSVTMEVPVELLAKEGTAPLPLPG